MPRVAALAELLERHPGHVAAREALVLDLIDAGERERAREAERATSVQEA